MDFSSPNKAALMWKLSVKLIAIKTVQQQDIQATQRIREELVGQRTDKVNQICGLAIDLGRFKQAVDHGAGGGAARRIRKQ